MSKTSSRIVKQWLTSAIIALAALACTGHAVPVAEEEPSGHHPGGVAGCDDPSCCPRGQWVCDDPDEGGLCHCVTWGQDADTWPGGSHPPGGVRFSCEMEDEFARRDCIRNNSQDQLGGDATAGQLVDASANGDAGAAGTKDVGAGSEDVGVGVPDATSGQQTDALTNGEGDECIDGVPLADEHGKPFGEDTQLIVTLSEPKACIDVTVDKTGYYRLFDQTPAESCLSQTDEIAYLRISNSCNEQGWPIDPNLGQRFIVQDVDNTPPCSGKCDGDLVCREGLGHAGRCCVPNRIDVGTFLLVAGEKNKMCWHHFCPEWKKDGQGDRFVSDEQRCGETPQSVHLLLAGLSACISDRAPACR